MLRTHTQDLRQEISGRLRGPQALFILIKPQQNTNWNKLQQNKNHNENVEMQRPQEMKISMLRSSSNITLKNPFESHSSNGSDSQSKHNERHTEVKLLHSSHNIEAEIIVT